MAAGLLAATLAAAGCGAGGGAAAPQPSSPQPTSSPAAVAAKGRSRRAKRPPHRPQRRHRRAAAPFRGREGSLAYSTASNEIVQPQPGPGSCRAIGSGVDSRPDPTCTPGALDPAVTQATIGQTICVQGWTATVRPPERVTEQEKLASMAAYGDTGSPADYEYDHLVPLELGGATNDRRNLWPEPVASPNSKDAAENELRREVCDGRISLAQAQRAIASNWVRLAQPSSPPIHSGTASPSAAARGAECTVTASYSSSHGDYDVYVKSNQPDRTVTVSDADGHSNRWHTDGSGYADVYFKSGGYAPGRRITAQVGQASCTATL